MSFSRLTGEMGNAVGTEVIVEGAFFGGRPLRIGFEGFDSLDTKDGDSSTLISSIRELFRRFFDPETTLPFDDEPSPSATPDPDPDPDPDNVEVEGSPKDDNPVERREILPLPLLYVGSAPTVTSSCATSTSASNFCFPFPFRDGGVSIATTSSWTSSTFCFPFPFRGGTTTSTIDVDLLPLPFPLPPFPTPEADSPFCSLAPTEGEGGVEVDGLVDDVDAPPMLRFDLRSFIALRVVLILAPLLFVVSSGNAFAYRSKRR